MTSMKKTVPVYAPPFICAPIDYAPPGTYPRKKSEEEVKEIAEEYRRHLIEMSEGALNYYNKKRGTDYELVEALASYSVMLNNCWSHFNFKAKKKSASDEGTTVKLFFGEEVFRNGKYEITTCQILDGTKEVVGCYFCERGSKPIIHPTSGMKMLLQSTNQSRLASLRPRPPKKH